MSDGANKALLANPMNWLANNILIVEVNPTNNKDRAKYITTGKTMTVNLVKAPDTAVDSGGRALSVWKVVRGSTLPAITSNRFKAYFLPWNQNDKKIMQLDEPGIDWFFTDTMNGCTFVSGPGANPKVGHFNYQVNNTAIDSPKINIEVAGEFPGGTLHRLDKADYMDAHGMVKVTTLGIRTGTAWNFYYQKREIVSLIPPKWTLPDHQPIPVP